MVVIKPGSSRLRNSPLAWETCLASQPALVLSEIRCPVLFKYLPVKGEKGRAGV